MSACFSLTLVGRFTCAEAMVADDHVGYQRKTTISNVAGERKGEILVTSSLVIMDVREKYWVL
jgi:hypothetical protein